MNMQPFLPETNTGLLVADVAASMPAERVMVLYHPRGWQVAVVRMDGEQILPTVYPDIYDAERVATGVALKYEITLICDDDPRGEIADDWVNRLRYADEVRDAETRWML